MTGVLTLALTKRDHQSHQQDQSSAQLLYCLRGTNWSTSAARFMHVGLACANEPDLAVNWQKTPIPRPASWAQGASAAMQHPSRLGRISLGYVRRRRQSPGPRPRGPLKHGGVQRGQHRLSTSGLMSQVWHRAFLTYSQQRLKPPLKKPKQGSHSLHTCRLVPGREESKFASP